MEQPKLLRPPNGATLREYQIVGLQVGSVGRGGAGRWGGLGGSLAAAGS